MHEIALGSQLPAGRGLSHLLQQQQHVVVNILCDLPITAKSQLTWTNESLTSVLGPYKKGSP